MQEPCEVARRGSCASSLDLAQRYCCRHRAVAWSRHWPVDRTAGAFVVGMLLLVLLHPVVVVAETGKKMGMVGNPVVVRAAVVAKHLLLLPVLV